MPKAKVGDRIRIVNALMSMGEYTEGDEGKITALCDEDCEDVMVSFDHYEEGEGSMYVLGEEYEVISSEEEHPRKTGDVPKIGGVPDTTPGKGYRIVSLSMEDNEVIFIDDVGDKQYRDIDSRFKFHSRPL